MRRRPIPTMAWVLAGATAVALVTLLFPMWRAHGLPWFFRQGDSGYFRAVALDPFGTGHAIARAGQAREIAYRYGRPGFPLLAWVLAGGQPALVPWSLIGVQVAATGSIPALAAVLADEHDAPPEVGAVVLLSPLVFLLGLVFAEPLMIALVLLGYVLARRGRRTAAIGVFAYAVLVKETAALALIPWIVTSLRRRRVRDAVSFGVALLPYLVWCVVVRIRMGEFPFLAHTVSRRDATGLPGAALRRIVADQTPGYLSVMAMVLVTMVLCAAGAYLLRQSELGGLAAVLGALVACLGDNALSFSQEAFRLLMFPQVCALLCIGIGVGRRWTRSADPVATRIELAAHETPTGAAPQRIA